MYQKTTHGISVSVFPLFLSEASQTDKNLYTWAYHVQINNYSSRTVKLKKRLWRIFGIGGNYQETSGSALIDNQELHPGESYEYASGATLSAPSGIMQGVCEVETIDGEHLEIDLPSFSLDSPYQTFSLN